MAFQIIFRWPQNEKMHYLFFLTTKSFRSQENKMALKKIQKGWKIKKYFQGPSFLVLPKAPDSPEMALASKGIKLTPKNILNTIVYNRRMKLCLKSISSTFYEQLLHKRNQTVNVSVFFALLGSACTKAAHRTLLKLIPNYLTITTTLMSNSSLSVFAQG